MSRFFVAGLINIETTLLIDGFPLNYFPVRYPFFGIQTTVSGVGVNLTVALQRLGNQVDFASLVGEDDNGYLVRQDLKARGINIGMVLDGAKATAQSVILYTPEGQRQIHVDLKDIQRRAYPIEKALPGVHACDLAVICNINFARPLLKAAQSAGKPIATDVHALSVLTDDYNQDFMAAADILFLSDESLPDSPEAVARELMARYKAEMIVIGLGASGALLAVREDDFVGRFPAIKTRQVVNTIGAGDALLAAFLDRYLRTKDPYKALRAAMVFASYKIGESGAAQGFMTGEELDDWMGRNTPYDPIHP